jgi:hypothetical protein
MAEQQTSLTPVNSPNPATKPTEPPPSSSIRPRITQPIQSKRPRKLVPLMISGRDNGPGHQPHLNPGQQPFVPQAHRQSPQGFQPAPPPIAATQRQPAPAPAPPPIAATHRQPAPPSPRLGPNDQVQQAVPQAYVPVPYPATGSDNFINVPVVPLQQAPNLPVIHVTETSYPVDFHFRGATFRLHATPSSIFGDVARQAADRIGLPLHQVEFIKFVRPLKVALYLRPLHEIGIFNLDNKLSKTVEVRIRKEIPPYDQR